MTKPNFKPEGYGTVTPYLTIKGAAEAIEFYKKLFDAEEIMRFEMQGSIGHAELQIGDSRVMLSEEWPDYGVKGPKALGGTPVGMMLYVSDVDALAKKAEDAGCKVIQPLQDQFYGDRSCKIEDPFGHQWSISTHIEDVSVEEMQERAKKLFS